MRHSVYFFSLCTFHMIFLTYLQTQKCFFSLPTLPFYQVLENLSAMKSTLSYRAAAVQIFLGADMGIQGSPVCSSTGAHSCAVGWQHQWGFRCMKPDLSSYDSAQAACIVICKGTLILH